jgi:hypothetical protein
MLELRAEADVVNVPQDRPTCEPTLTMKGPSHDVEKARVERFSAYDLDELRVLILLEGGTIFKDEGDAAYVAQRIDDLEKKMGVIEKMDLATLECAQNMKVYGEAWAIKAVASRIEALQASASVRAGMPGAPRAVTPWTQGPSAFTSPPVTSGHSTHAPFFAAPPSNVSTASKAHIKIYYFIL